jgi:ubiquinone/menaquinone biosynthesis C-methylase UbiE
MSNPLPQSPSGFMGILFGKLMEFTNADAYNRSLLALAPSDHERFLEIGFGTGRFAEMLLSTTTGTFLAGVDPTETMVKTASNRLIKQGLGDFPGERLRQRIDLRQGTDDSLPWGDNQFDAVIAIHAFQFWSDPDLSLTEISRVLRPQGRIAIVFRDHSSHAPDWLPNPISRSEKEVELATNLLEKYGYMPTEYPSAGSSRIILYQQSRSI